MVHTLGSEISLTTLRIQSAGLGAELELSQTLFASGSLGKARRECLLSSLQAGLGGNRLSLGHPKVAKVEDIPEGKGKGHKNGFDRQANLYH